MLSLDLSEPELIPVPTSRRRRALVAAAVAVVLLAAGGVGYLALHDSGQDTIRRPAIGAPLAPAPTPQTPGAPDPHPSPRLAHPAAAAAAVPTGVAIADPGTARPPTPTASASSNPAQPRPLAATYRYLIGDDLLTGYVGTVTITNAAPTPASRWTVRLTVPLANAVTVRKGDVTVTRDGPTVIFVPSPTAAPIPARSMVAFTFELSGTLAALPTGCTVNGTACT